MSFKKVEPHPNFPQIEEEILKFWDENEIFEKSLEKNSPENKYVFYEGPPTANGRPGIHHVLARAFKDLIPRFKTMKGFYVKRRAGWDTHGLPVEIEVEKELGLKNKKEIEAYGVAQFNEKCRQSVWRYKKEWEDLTKRIAFWVDLKNPYVTYENNYIEKVWGILKQIWDKDLIYSGFKVVPYCPRCGTTLSSHEVAQGYKNIEEETIYLKIALKGEKNKYFLVWTTTPWTLPANIALAINKDIDYVEAESAGEVYILAKERLKILGDHKILKEFKGSELIGKEYEPLYDASSFVKINSKKDYRVWDALFVSAKDGSGIVHIAPAFGEDDMNLQKEKEFSVPMTVDENGMVLSKVGKGKFVKDADLDIKSDLEKRELLFKKEKIRHDYPFCWRCDSILIYYAMSTWFINMSKVQEKLVQNNESVSWVPAYIKQGRFGKWLLEAKDWALSRQRFWGTPLPIWQCECGHKIMIGSVEELRKLTNNNLEKLDLHKPYIDEIKIKCPQCQKEMTRVNEVIDVWFDSGSMPFASEEYPDYFPADYISEAVDQTRGWFYTMLAISTLIDQGAPYKNVICLAHVLDEQGKKMSKSRGNVINPWDIINKYGTDSLRWYFFTVNNPGDPKRLSERSIEITQRRFVALLWNVYSFFTTYANLDNWTTERKKDSKNILDQWIVSELGILNQVVENSLEKYDVVTAARQIQNFTNELSTWYLRRSRKRRDDEFYSTLYEVLFTLSKIIAPFAPLTAEAIYGNLKTANDLESVHLNPWPEKNEINTSLVNQMATVRHLVEMAHAERANSKIKVRQPLNQATIRENLDSTELLDLLKDEINVKEIKIDTAQETEIKLDINITEELKQEGLFRDIVRLIQDLRKKSGLLPGQKVVLNYKADVELENIISKFSSEIAQSTSTELKKIAEVTGQETEFTLEGKKIWLKLEK